MILKYLSVYIDVEGSASVIRYSILSIIYEAVIFVPGGGGLRIAECRLSQVSVSVELRSVQFVNYNVW